MSKIKKLDDTPMKMDEIGIFLISFSVVCVRNTKIKDFVKEKEKYWFRWFGVQM